MIIMKFGGTSVKDADAMRRAVDIIRSNLQSRPLIVVSALGGVTNLLIEALTAAASRNIERVEQILEILNKRHLEMTAELIPDSGQQKILNNLILSESGKLKTLLDAVSAIRVESDKLSHAVMSTGEILSSHILAAYLKSTGISCGWFDARKVITVRFNKLGVEPLHEEIRNKAQKKLLPLLAGSEAIATQGFIALTDKGAPATLGRDGSDYTASLLGAALDAEEIQIWSDVDGILSADPSIIPKAKPLKKMTFAEACELAYFGARVLHPQTIQPALEQDISVRVLNSNFPREAGTTIVAVQPDEGDYPIKSIAYKENITLLTIDSSKLLLSPQIIEECFDILTRHGKRVYAVSKSAAKLSVTIENTSDLSSLKKELDPVGQLTVESKKVIISVVGEQMKNNPSLTWKIIEMLNKADVHLDLISQFASQISLMFIIDEKDIDKAVKLLHKHFIRE